MTLKGAQICRQISTYWQQWSRMFFKYIVQASSFQQKEFLFREKSLKTAWNLLAKNHSTTSLKEIYAKAKQTCLSKKLPKDVNPDGVFACNELDLNEIQVYGFDYDYTLACYKTEMDMLLFDLAKRQLVENHTYPKDIMNLQYDPDFMIRGLHYDIKKALFMKLDSFLQIQLGTVYKGLKQVPDEKVIQLYKNKVIPIAYVENSKRFDSKNTKLYQLSDLFSKPEMALLSCITDYFESNNIDYNPEILFRDVKVSIRKSHPIMHDTVQRIIKKFLVEIPELRELFTKLKCAKKQLFLVTNSPYAFVNKGLSLLLGPDWVEFFDIIIVQAKKPQFFTDDTRPIRVLDVRSSSHTFRNKVTELEKGVIYCEGNIHDLKEITGWSGCEVLYFGDHPYTDLADATLEHGWRTGAIIHELTHEISTLNNKQFKADSNWLQVLTQLIEEHIDKSDDATAAEEIKKWVEERNCLLESTKKVFNPQFGSVFRTYNNPTYFSRRLFRFADIYTSNIKNLLHYSLKHTFFPRRGALPHEYASLFM